MNVLFAAMAFAQGPAVAEMAPAAPLPIGESYLAAAGIQMASLKMGDDTVTIYLPGDMMGGDTISGSAYASGALVGSTIDVMGTTVPLNNKHGFTVKIPSDAVSFTISMASGAANARAEISLSDGVRTNPWFLSPVANENGVVTMLGRFDGSRHTTTAKVDGRDMAILTESPRRLTLSAVGLSLGRHALKVEEGMGVESGEFNVARAMLHPDRVRSGKSDLKLIVEGLAGMSAGDYPLSVGLINESPDVIRFEPDSTTYAVVPVMADGVKDGVWNGKTLVRTKKRKPFSMIAFLASDALISRMR